MYPEDLEYFGIISPAIKGMVDKIPIIYLKDAFSDIENAFIRDSEVVMAKLREPDFLNTGAKTQTPDGNPIIHTVTFTKQTTGAEYFLAFTKANIYHWNTTTSAWDSKTPSGGLTESSHWDTCIYNDMVFATNNQDFVLYWNTTGNFAYLGNSTYGIIYNYSTGATTVYDYNTGSTVDAESAADQAVVNVTATTNFTVGDTVILDRGNTNEETGVIESIDAGVSITLESNLTNTHAVDVVVEVCDPAGESGQKVLLTDSTTNFTAGDIVIIDRGNTNEEHKTIDTVQAGTSITLTENLSNDHSTGIVVEICLRTTKAKYITTKDNYLILGYPTDNGTAYPTRIRWSSIGNEDGWDNAGSGAREIGMTGEIVAFGEYENFLVVFKDKTIQFVYLVAGNAVWNNYVYSHGIGGTGHHSVVNDTEGNLYFFGSDGVFREIKGGEISFIIDKYVRNIDPDNRDLIYGMYIEELNQIWWAVPYDNALNNIILTYDRQNKSWSKLDVAAPALGYYHES